MSRKQYSIIVIIFAFVVGLLVGSVTVLWWFNNEYQYELTFVKERHSGTDKLINPLLTYDTAETKTPFINDINASLNEFIGEVVGEAKANTVGVYFRDLNNGPWFGINEVEYFSPASLIKVSYLIAALLTAETDSSFLNRTVYLKENDIIDTNQSYEPHKQLQLNTPYSIEEVLEHMIVYSDNRAANLLMREVDSDLYKKVLYEIGGIDIKKLNKVENAVQPKNYSAFWRILYNASYLNRTMSQKALELLTKTEFSSGIVAGVPSKISVAHKFGERVVELSGEYQLHDCGIVYYPKHPYLLCIMTKGSNFQELEKIISVISQKVYYWFDDSLK